MRSFDSIVSEARGNKHPLVGNCEGIYFLYDEDEVVYVGQGWNSLLRVGEHTRKESDKRFTHWAYVKVQSETERDALERGLIAKLNPKYNKTHRTDLDDSNARQAA